MNKEKIYDMIYEYLLRKAIGHENSVTSREISEELGLDHGWNNFKLRNNVKKMVEEHNYPIGSCGDGYFIINNALDIEIARQNISYRIESLNKRIEKFDEMTLRLREEKFYGIEFESKKQREI